MVAEIINGTENKKEYIICIIFLELWTNLIYFLPIRASDIYLNWTMWGIKRGNVCLETPHGNDYIQTDFTYFDEYTYLIPSQSPQTRCYKHTSPLCFYLHSCVKLWSRFFSGSSVNGDIQRHKEASHDKFLIN